MCTERVKCKSFVLITLCDSEGISSFDKVITNMNSMEWNGTNCTKTEAVTETEKEPEATECADVLNGFESFTGYINFSSTSKRQHVTPEAYLRSLQLV